MKKISIIVMCFNEVDNVIPMYEALTGQMKKMEKYDYEIIYPDNASTDGTVEKLHQLAQRDHRVKVIFNNRNYGPQRSFINALKHVTGDVELSIPCDFQEPPEMIPEFIQYWEDGYKVVCGQKQASEEGKLKYGLRSLYYKIIAGFSETPQIPHISGIVLMEREVVDAVLASDEDISTRNLLAEMGYNIKLIPYIQKERRSGKSSYNLSRYFSFAINSLVTTSTAPLRIATILGIFTAFFSLLIGIVYLIYKIAFWNTFQAGTTPILIGMFFLGAVQLICIGLVGEYVGVILNKVSKRPGVIEKEVLNFEE